MSFLDKLKEKQEEKRKREGEKSRRTPDQIIEDEKRELEKLKK